MRCFGAAAVYTTGVVFALPKFKSEEAESKAAEASRTVGSNKQIALLLCHGSRDLTLFVSFYFLSVELAIRVLGKNGI
jgi:hypothetical protein